MEKKLVFQSVEERNQQRREKARRMSHEENLREMERLHHLNQSLPVVNRTVKKYENNIILKRKNADQ